MPDFLADLSRVRSEVSAELEQRIAEVIVMLQYRTGFSGELLSAIACEAVANIYQKQRAHQAASAATILRWLADEADRHAGAETSDADDGIEYE